MRDLFDALWRALGTDQGKLLFGFVLTTLVGGVLTSVFQWLSWRRQARIDLFRQRYVEGTQLLEQLSSMIDKRYFRLQRLVWAIGDSALPEKIVQREKEYFEAVVEWNEKLRSIHNRLRLLVGDSVALQFLDYADDYRQQDPQSLHYKFVKAHRAVLRAKDDGTKAASAKEEVDRLNWSVSRFAYDVTTLFMSRASSLELLRAAVNSTEQVKARQVSGPPWSNETGSSTNDPAARKDLAADERPSPMV
jgi:hypothetical protein